MKQNVKKFISAIIIAIIMFNVIFPITSSAKDDGDNGSEASSGFLDSFNDIVFGVGVDGIVGILFTATLKIPIYLLAKIPYTIISLLVSGNKDVKVTPNDIIFAGADNTEKIDLVDINFFDDDSGTIGSSIAKWYFALRNLAIVASLVVLIYVGIRMAISAVASEKAKYKQMLKDWAMGFAMLFLLHYLMVAVIALNRVFVNLIYNIGVGVNGGKNLSNIANAAELMIFNNAWFTKSVGALVIFAVIAGITVAFFVQYVKRFFTIGFLITISPLITVTYSIDKMGDGRSQALNTWLREFIFNVVIQPFHCIIYTLLCSTAVTALGSEASLKNVVIAIASLLFVFKAEDIVKNIFGFRAGSMENAAAAGALVAGVLTNFQRSSNKAAKAVGKAGGNVTRNNAKDIKRMRVIDSTDPKTASTRPDTKTKGFAGRMAGRISQSRLGQSGFGQAVGKAGSAVKGAIGSTALGEAVSDFAKDNAQNWEQFKAAKGKTILKGVGNATLKFASAGYKVAPKVMTGAFVAGMTGDAKAGIAAGYIAQGGKFTRKMTELADKDLGKLQEDSKTKRLANEIDDFVTDSYNATQDKFISKEELYNKCLDLYDADISTLTDATEKRLAKRLQELGDFYAGKGEQDAAAKVMSKVSDIQLRGANHSIQIRADNVVDAAKAYSQATYGTQTGHASDVQRVVEKIQEDINNSADNNENYWKSAEFDSLGKNGQKLAREIYKAKKLNTAIGNAPQDKLDKAVQNKVEDKLR